MQVSRPLPFTSEVQFIRLKFGLYVTAMSINYLSICSSPAALPPRVVPNVVPVKNIPATTKSMLAAYSWRP